MTENIGTKRVESQIRFIITDALQRHLADPRLEKIASITQVKVSNDLAYADVYFSVMGSKEDEKEFITGIERAKGLLQKLVAKNLRTRTCPQLRFHLDESIKKGFETMQAIDRAMERTKATNPDKIPSPEEEGKAEGDTPDIFVDLD